ncbi:hypothetical protein NP493_899g00027 [Ridgeia piscesae]|uniref:Trafficking protein particle complex subunit 11 domain-containing protein n=1 Tax=Ridgeia piscesae TaxID=27915 RepID=A0AAD9KMH0_RIDPI|nr:hypothetical protein NP493_899g00027 [Ridgeia piscesae]
MAWASEFPTELLCRPVGLVVLTGLDITYNAVHKAIWDSFCNNRRADRVPLQFVVLQTDHEYPKCRTKRTSYEWYIPKGIVKTGWMKKHMELIPSVVVMFFDIDWDEPQWRERQMECSTKVQIVRNSLLGRSTRVAVVLIQKNTPLPPGEDVIAAERAASLCSACELSAKSLFVLPLADHLLGYTIRLENAFYELSQTYYHTEARRVKAHKEFLNKTTHQLLFVRHQFKIAFYNEQKQDTHTALKHYKQAYSYLLELRMHDTNLLEVKIIGGFINYKICRLSFQHNVPLDALTQFRKHIDFFKKKAGCQDLSFEHSAWMSKQFQVFGDLFDEAIKLGLTAIQIQHPGFYYHQAANHAVTRKQLCRSLCHLVSVATEPDPLESLWSLEYYGQRSWRQGHQSIEPPDAQREREGVVALQQLELKVDHSWVIIPLFSSAVAQFRKYKSPRMKRYLMVEMGEEYYHAADYPRALALLTRVTADYRQEHWWLLLTSVLITALKCAYLMASLQDYVTISLEVIGEHALCSREDKTRIQMNLIKAMSNELPEPEPGCSATCVEKAKQQWKSLQDPSVVSVEMQAITPFIECKASFTQDMFRADSPVLLTVCLRSTAQFPVQFSKMSVTLSNQVYNPLCVLTGTGSEVNSLYVVPGQSSRHTFSFLPQSEDVGKTLEIVSVSLELGSDDSRCAILHWTGGGSVSGGGFDLPPPINSPSLEDATPWEQVLLNTTTRINRREALIQVTVDHEAPCLVNEFFLIETCVENLEESTIKNAHFCVSLKTNVAMATEHTTHVSVETPEFEGSVVSRRDVELDPVEHGVKVERQVYVKALEAGDITVVISVTYDIDVEVKGQMITCTCQKVALVDLTVVDPFKIMTQLTSTQFAPIETLHTDEPFLLTSHVTCSCDWPVKISSSTLHLSPFVKAVDGKLTPQMDGVSLKNDDCASECFCLVAPPGVHATVPLGQYTVEWKRLSSDTSLPYVTTTLTLPAVKVEHVPLHVDLDMSAYATMREDFPLLTTSTTALHTHRSSNLLWMSATSSCSLDTRRVDTRCATTLFHLSLAMSPCRPCTWTCCGTLGPCRRSSPRCSQHTSLFRCLPHLYNSLSSSVAFHFHTTHSVSSGSFCNY